ncbi:cation-translocating P-type ATPase [Limnohabitans sp. MMS-10A-192]|uniref:heavy metal translocating P-type ATPase n=1 Tax=unclassified Limnohabitans TaxID=2626134 RepID=UPI002101B65D|nr:heavy metal translocating P-type ATPase [Limnohabitans sp. MMS-10A-192]
MRKKIMSTTPESTKPENCQSVSCCSAAACAPTTLSEQDVTQTRSDQPKNKFRISNMDCASEEAEIRRALDGIQGIDTLRFDLGARVLTISASEAALPGALQAIRKAGFKPEAVEEEGNTSSNASAASPAFWKVWGKLLAALGLALAAEAINYAFPSTSWVKALGMGLAMGAIFLSGFGVYGKGLAALRQGRLNINALMSVAVTGAFLIGQWPEAAMVMALYAIAEAIEARAVDRARGAIKSLLALSPEQAEVRQEDGRWLRLGVRSVALNSIVRIAPGERVPLDGIVVAGQSAVDQSPLTGESLPVDKGPGDEVYAGTINQASALEMQVTAPASDSTLSRIIKAVEEAQATRAPTQRFVDQFAAIYTPAVFVLALLVALLMPWVAGLTWLEAVYKALVLLVIACPCALVISTPVSVVSGLAAGARRGILIKGGVYLEEARKIKAVALDKTGTITEGKPKLVAFEPVATDEAPEHIELLAKSLAARSDHPVSKAIAQGLAVQPQEVNSFEAVAGRGVQGVIDGHPYILANHRWIEERSQCSAQLEARLAVHEEAGRTVTILANRDRVIALFAVADTIKPSSIEAISEMKALGVVPIMLTGDNAATARTVGHQAGISEIRGNLLPEDKLKAIEEFQERYGVTAMTGDGINDAPALAKANIGFAMGAAGTHTAMEAADVVVMNDDLRRIPETIRLSKRTHIILWQNITLALGIKAVFLLMAIFDDASMWMAVFADMGASLLVVFNGLRLLKAAK